MGTVLSGKSDAAAPGYDGIPCAGGINVEALFREHHQHLLRFVKRYVRNEADVEDVVQNTFTEAIRCADRFSGLSKPSTWLFGIALNLAHNQVRRNGADLLEATEDGFFERVQDLHGDPATLVEQRQIAALVDELLNQLPEKIRDTFLIVVEGNCTYEEAAEQLQVPIGTIRSRVSRVRNTIREYFGHNRASGSATTTGLSEECMPS